MYLFLLVFLVAVGLVIWFVFLSEASLMAKAVIAVLFVVSLFLHPAAFPVAGLFLRIGISIFVLFYQIIQSTRSQ